jgi:undecaprenyl-diphosphatase
MSAIQAAILGIVQGLTEFLPVSSSAHLILVPWLFGWHFFQDNPELNKTFDVALHLGTFFALLFFFWREIVDLLVGFFGTLRRRRIASSREKLSWLLLVASIPAGIAGVALESFIEEKLGAPWLIAVLMIVFAFVILAVDELAANRRTMEQLGWRDAIIVGVAQVLALAPGVSRSGVTMTAGRALEMRREVAVRFSFLISIPVTAGAALYKGAKLAVHGIPGGTAMPFVVGILAATVSGYFAVRFLLAYVAKHDFKVFVIYRVVVGVAILAVIALGLRSGGGF